MSPPPKRSTSLGKSRESLPDHLLSSFHDLWLNYCKRLKRCQKVFSEKSVHNLRVATRRMLSQLDLMRAMLAAEELRQVRRAFKKRLNVFGRLRDTQVELDRAEKLQRDVPALTDFHNTLRKREKRLIKSTRKKVAAFKTRKLARTIAGLEERARNALNEPGAKLQLDFRIRQAIEKSFARTEALQRQIDPTDTSTIHKTRVAFKRFRYMVESLHPVLPGVTKEQLHAMHDYQVMMGHIHDLEILTAHLDKFAAKLERKQQTKKRKTMTDRSWRDCREALNRQHAVLVKDYGASADQLFAFWPPRAEEVRGT